MSTCPGPEELSRLLDGELTENRAVQVRAHAAGCPACAATLRAEERLLARLAAPVPGVPSPGALAAIIARLDTAEAPPAGAATPPRRPLGPPAWANALAAAAVLVVAVTAAWPRRPEGFLPRGGEVAWARAVGVSLWALEGAPRRLTPGDRLGAGVPIVASVANAAGAPAYLLAFAVDGRGETHWLYPAFLDLASDPEAVRLDPGAGPRALPDAAVLDEVAPGALLVITVVSRTPRRVSEIEGATPAGRTPEALRRRWPDAAVEALALRAEAAPPSAGARP